MSQIAITQPTEISRSSVLDLLRSLGLDPMEITQDGIEIRHDVIRCRVAARDSSGRYFVDGDELATHEVVIRVVDDPK